MVRIYTRRTQRNESHPELVTYGFVDVESPELEAELTRGGFGPMGCDVTQAVSVQVNNGEIERLKEGNGHG